MLLFYGVGKLRGPYVFFGKLLVVAFVGDLTGRRFSVGNFTFSRLVFVTEALNLAKNNVN